MYSELPWADTKLSKWCEEALRALFTPCTGQHVKSGWLQWIQCDDPGLAGESLDGSRLPTYPDPGLCAQEIVAAIVGSQHCHGWQ
jgi:hypothetical protein